MALQTNNNQDHKPFVPFQSAGTLTQFDLTGLFLCECQSYSQANQNATCQALEELREARAVQEPFSNGAGRISDDEQETQSKESKGESQNHHLQCDMTAIFVNELGQEG